MWLDGAYMAEPFRAEYAATFQQPADFDDIARQLLLMDQHMRDPDSGLLKHGWDESKQMPWADKTTGLSPEVWGRAMGWYAMALVDVLDWFPASHPQRAALVAALNRTMAAVVQAQDPKTGLWWQVLTHDTNQATISRPPQAACSPTRSPRASAWAIFRRPMKTTPSAPGRESRSSSFHRSRRNTHPARHGQGRRPRRHALPRRRLRLLHPRAGRRSGKKGVGAFLLAGSEMEQSSTEALGQGKTALVDAWLNSQTRKTALGQTELYHYKWDDDHPTATPSSAAPSSVTASRSPRSRPRPPPPRSPRPRSTSSPRPTSPSRTPPALYGSAQRRRHRSLVRSGGVLLLFSNDRDNTEFDRSNTLSDRFGIHFNPVLSHHVVGDDRASGEVVIPPGTGISAQASSRL